MKFHWDILPHIYTDKMHTFSSQLRRNTKLKNFIAYYYCKHCLALNFKCICYCKKKILCKNQKKKTCYLCKFSTFRQCFASKQCAKKNGFHDTDRQIA